MLNHFKIFFSVFVGNFLCFLLWDFVILKPINKVTKPYVIELREKWRYGTKDSAMKDINRCCSQTFCLKPESRLCEFDKQFHRDFVDHIQNNECYDLYDSNDFDFF